MRKFEQKRTSRGKRRSSSEKGNVQFANYSRSRIVFRAVGAGPPSKDRSLHEMGGSEATA